MEEKFKQCNKKWKTVKFKNIGIKSKFCIKLVNNLLLVLFLFVLCNHTSAQIGEIASIVTSLLTSGGAGLLGSGAGLAGTGASLAGTGAAAGSGIAGAFSNVAPRNNFFWSFTISFYILSLRHFLFYPLKFKLFFKDFIIKSNKNRQKKY